MTRVISLVLVVVSASSCGSRVAAESADVRLKGLKQPVEILRDRWGVPHVYARDQADLFFANGYINARDRLFQLDLWRRIGTGRLAEVLGPGLLARDRMARLFWYRGDWHREWESYSPDTREIVFAFTAGINAYIESLHGTWPVEFRVAGYAPGLWTPEDVTARLAGLSISRNLAAEVARAQDVVRFGPAALARVQPTDPIVALTPPPGGNLAAIPAEVLQDYSLMFGDVPFGEHRAALPVLAGSNDWAVDGSKSTTGKPMLAADPHRDLELPSLRRTIHLVGPGWNVIGAGEPALPGVALGHNDAIAWGFTIAGTDQQDLYVERLNPASAQEYWYKGDWRRMSVVTETIPVKGKPGGEAVDLQFSVHGPVIYRDGGKRNAFAVRWTGLEPGGAGYLASLALARARNWDEFQTAAARFRVPSENLLYADTAGHIGMVVGGLTPLRKGYTGLLPVPGTGEFEWSGFLPASEMPSVLDPPQHFIATANNDIRPPRYPHILTYEWGTPYRAQRATELLSANRRFEVSDFERMQYDFVSIPARRCQAVLRRWPAPAGRLGEMRDRLLRWDARIVPESSAALIFEMMYVRLGPALFGKELGARAAPEVVLARLEASSDYRALETALEGAAAELERALGPNPDRWLWARASQLWFDHPLNVVSWSFGPMARGGDANTLNAAGGGVHNPAGASYRQVIDLADWDRSTMTNVPGESGEPVNKHYGDLLEDWRNGRYHPMPFSRKAVEAVTEEKIILLPIGGG